ncbi:DNA-3-methyladenine glycosylase family protein [Paenibacillus nasutitermitis]|uniref:DNA-3-methyladenine glycosylase II n=1 Tax=Paenibacillus nasutitermitis TaxID=1652958 RepID=A0A916YYI1_9BACL|nr:DNA-3-methyladenine glycosylase [Paenibacillus nasutitermitis]GGD67057.1 DNA-3-methyladenine glycosylase [Paenibacillus nasutitermitis]
MTNQLNNSVKGADHHFFYLLYPPEPFSFQAVLGYLSRSSKECMFAVTGGQVTRLVPVGDEHILVRLSGAEDGSIRIDFAGDAPLPEAHVREAVASYVWEWFDLERDLKPFYDMAEGNPLLQNAIEKHYGLRIIGIHQLFEALCWGVMGQQINLAFAYTLKKKFVETFGESVEWEGQSYWIFPEPSRIAGLSVEDLTPLQLTGKKSEYLIGIASLMDSGQLSKEKLLALGELQAIEKELVGIRGIGPWTANYVLMRCLRIPTAFPIADVGLHNAIKHVMNLENKPTLQQIREFSAPWGEWLSYSTFYLWRMID